MVCSLYDSDENTIPTQATPQKSNDNQSPNPPQVCNGYTGCPPCSGSQSGNCIIDNATGNCRRFGKDYVRQDSKASCAACGASRASVGDELQLYRVQSLRNLTWPSSFGAGNFLNYDISLLFSAAVAPPPLGLSYASGLATIKYADPVTIAAPPANVSVPVMNGTPAFIQCFNPQWDAPITYNTANDPNIGAVFKDGNADQVKEVVMYNAAGAPVTDMTATSASMLYKDGRVMQFELFSLNPQTGVQGAVIAGGAGSLGGRLLGIKDANGVAQVTITYVNPAVSAVDSSLKWQIATITDAHGMVASLTYGTLATGLPAVSQISVPGGRTIAYAYDTAGRLSTVTGLTGDVSTFAYSTTTNGSLQIVVNEAAEEGVHRNETAVFSSSYAVQGDFSSVLPTAYGYAANLISQELNGVGEESYSKNGVIIHEGGNKYRSFTSSTYSASSVRFGEINGVPQAPDNPLLTTNSVDGSQMTQTKPDGRFNVRNYSFVDGSLLSDYTQSAPTATTGYAYTYDPVSGKVATQLGTDGVLVANTYDANGNLLSRVRSQVPPPSLQTVGTTVPGFGVAYYNSSVAAPALPAGPNYGTLVGAATTGFLSPVANPSGANVEVLSGTLTVASSGLRVFQAGASPLATVLLSIDGNAVPLVNGSGSVNLAAGSHQVALVTSVTQGLSGAPMPLSLWWAGPETATNPDPNTPVLIAANYVTHVAQTGEMAVTGTGTPIDQESWTYNAAGTALAGLVATHTDAAGKTTQYAYDGNRRLITVQEPNDAGTPVTVKALTYDTVGRLATSTDAMGRTVTYTYDARDRVVQTAYADGTAETVTYGTGANANLVVGTTDRSGNMTQYLYDNAGREIERDVGYATVAQGVLPSGSAAVTLTSYVPGTDLVASTTVDGKVTQYAYDYKGDVIATTQSPNTATTLASAATYDPLAANVTARTDIRGRSTYEYRSGSLVTRIVKELIPGSAGGYTNGQTLTRVTGANPAYEITDLQYDSESRLIRTIDPMGVSYRTDYDVLGRVIDTVDDQGGPNQATTATTYDAAGRVATRTDALGRVTTRSYLPSGLLGKITYPDGTYDSYSHYADGRLQYSLSPNGNRTDYYWTPCCGRPLAQTNAADDNGVVSLFYDGDVAM